jgi:hypothetical protein
LPAEDARALTGRMQAPLARQREVLLDLPDDALERPGLAATVDKVHMPVARCTGKAFGRENSPMNVLHM